MDLSYRPPVRFCHIIPWLSKKVNFDTMFGIFDNTGLGYKDRLQPKVYITKDTVYKEVKIELPKGYGASKQNYANSVELYADFSIMNKICKWFSNKNNRN